MSIYLVDYENVNRDGLTGIEQLGEEDGLYIFYSKKADTITFDLHRRINECPARISIFQVGGIEHRDALDFQLVSYLGYLIAEEKQEAYFIVSRDNGYLCVRDFWKERGVSVEIAKNLMKPEKKAETRGAQMKEVRPVETQLQETQPVEIQSKEVRPVETQLQETQPRETQPVEKSQPEKPSAPEKSAGKELAAPFPVKKDETGKKQGKPPQKAPKKKEEESLLASILAVIPEEKDARAVVKCLKKQKTKQGVNNDLVKEFGSKKGGELYRIVKKSFLKDKK